MGRGRAPCPRPSRSARCGARRGGQRGLLVWGGCVSRECDALAQAPPARRAAMQSVSGSMCQWVSGSMHQWVSRSMGQWASSARGQRGLARALDRQRHICHRHGGHRAGRSADSARAAGSQWMEPQRCGSHNSRCACRARRVASPPLLTVVLTRRAARMSRHGSAHLPRRRAPPAP
jgi:hypothetical protein